MSEQSHKPDPDQALASQVTRAVSLLKSGVPVAIPTETVYGLAAAIDNPAAIEQVFQLKARPFFDPLIVHISNVSELSSVASRVTAEEQLLMREFWPGPLTLILRKHPDLNPMICSGLETVGVRMPSHPVALEILQKTGVPLAAPSANRFGRTSPTEAAHVRSEWTEAEVFVVDAGSSDHGLESTVVRLSTVDERTTIEILRPGVVEADSLIEAFLRHEKTVRVLRVDSEASPGNVKHHYMPAAPLLIVPAKWLPLDVSRKKKISEDTGISFSGERELTLSEDPLIAARELYAKLRSLSDDGASCLVFGVEENRTSGSWEAIWDRLSRAATKLYTDAD